ncbi:hypothetical protein STEG23_003461 [Scotinomys teguina]
MRSGRRYPEMSWSSNFSRRPIIDGVDVRVDQPKAQVVGLDGSRAVAAWAKDIDTDPSCSGTTAPDMAIGSSSGLDVTMTIVAAKVTQISMTSVAAWPLDTNMIAGATDISTDSGYGRTTNPDMALHHSPGLDITMASGGSTDQSDQHGLHGSRDS